MSMGLAEDTLSYAKELAEAAGITEPAALDSFVKNDKVLARVRKSLEDVEREKGRVTAESKKAADAVAKSQQYYTETLAKVNEANTAIEQANAKVTAYVNRYGELPGGGNAADANARAAVIDAISKKDLDERLQKTEGLAIQMSKVVGKITARHMKNFPGDEPDFDAIEKIAIEKGLTAEKAYEDWAKPKYDAAALAKAEADKKAAIDAALVEDRSKRGASQVVDAQPRSEFMHNLKQKDDALTAKDSFLKGWREPEPKNALKTEFGRTS
jgi:hypothetical protein